jgi:UDP-N-acetylmuramate--alanine ligase
MPLIDPADTRPIHFIGVAGAGMSGLAELFVRRGAAVTGCDAAPDTTGDLARLGISVARGHDPSHVLGARAVVVTSALPHDHPEVETARRLGLPVIRRAEALAEAVSGGTLVAIAGTHGKTTTTVMTTEALVASGLDPTGVVGGRMTAWGGNLRPGGSALFVVEADEYDRSFLALAPTVAVVTNIEADHLDIYRDVADIRGAFAQFAEHAAWVIPAADDAGANSMPVPATARVLRYGTSESTARLVADNIRMGARSAGGAQADAASTFDVVYDGDRLGQLALQVPGLHNVQNALAAVAVGLALGVRFDAMVPGLERFRGVERRFERLGETVGVAIVDDYAHHPTEIRATLAAARDAYPGRRIVAAFQPHLYTRTRDFAGDFGAALAGADVVFLTEIYPSRERPIPGVTADLVATAAAQAGRPVAWRGERQALAGALSQFVEPGDVVLTMGAGDITRTGGELLALLSVQPPAHRSHHTAP